MVNIALSFAKSDFGCWDRMDAKNVIWIVSNLSSRVKLHFCALDGMNRTS